MVTCSTAWHVGPSVAQVCASKQGGERRGGLHTRIRALDGGEMVNWLQHPGSLLLYLLELWLPRMQTVSLTGPLQVGSGCRKGPGWRLGGEGRHSHPLSLWLCSFSCWPQVRETLGFHSAALQPPGTQAGCGEAAVWWKQQGFLLPGL